MKRVPVLYLEVAMIRLTTQKEKHLKLNIHNVNSPALQCTWLYCRKEIMETCNHEILLLERKKHIVLASG